MSLEERLAQPETFPAAGRRARHTHPAGWEPGVDTEKGVVTAVVDSTDGPDWSDVLTNLGLDPADWRVDGDQAEVRSWDTAGGGRCYYYKAKVSPAASAVDLDLEELAAKVRRRGPLRNATTPTGDGGGFLCVVLTDWQAGKGAGGGWRQLVERLERLGGRLEEETGRLRDAGVPVDNLAILLGGDLVEACDGHYAMQNFDVELDMRQQTKLVRRMLVELIDRWAPRFGTVVVAAAAGNHGEKRKGGKAYTSWSDNLDVEIPEQVAEILAANPDRYGHVRFRLPDADQLCTTVDLDGLVVAVAHGHQARRGGSTVQQKVMNWWGKMTETRHPVGDADALVVGHFHHHAVLHRGTHDGRGRTYLQAPCLDGGSPWFEQTGGGFTDAGTMTFTAVGGRLDHIRVLPAD